MRRMIPFDRKACTGLALAVACSALSGCGSGTAAIVATSGGSGGSSNTPTQVGNVGVTQYSQRVSPAEIHFSLTDPEGNPASVELRYSEQKGFAGSVLISAFEGLEATPLGKEHTYEWDFEPIFGSALTKEVFVLVVLAGKDNFSLGINAASTSLGNDPPQVFLDPGQFPISPEEASGILPVDFTISDSSNDNVQVWVEYATSTGGFLDWTPARPSGLPPGEPTPEPTIDKVTALETGTNLTFAWDSLFDLAGRDVDVRLRLHLEELPLEPGEPLTVSPYEESPTFNIDNNVPPSVVVDVVGFSLNPDRSRGIPVPFHVSDPESDPVRVVFQWTTEPGVYPPLPSSPDELDRLLADDTARRELRIAREQPLAFEGRVLTVHGADGARLPELASTAAILTSRFSQPAESLKGRELQILRTATPLLSASPLWGGASPLSSPVAVLPSDPGLLLVLDEPSPGHWQLRRLDTATGEVGLPIGGVQVGAPSTMAPQPDSLWVVVASRQPGGRWRLTRVDIWDGVVEELFEASLPLPLGPVRGLAPLRGGRCLVSVDDALLEVRYAEGGAPATARHVFDPDSSPPALLAPWGLAPDPRDPRRVFIAENGRDRVVVLDLSDLSLTPLRPPAPGLLRPTELAFDVSRTRLVVLTDENTHDNTREMRILKLGLRGATSAPELDMATLADALPAGVSGLAVGPLALRAVVDPLSDDVYIAGGVEQLRTVVAYDPATQVTQVDRPFQPPIHPGSIWRIEDRVLELRGGENSLRFVWDSLDEPGNIDVELRASAYDEDQGLASSGAPKTLRGALEAAVGEMQTCCVRLSGDMEGDGDVDFLGWEYGGGGVTDWVQVQPLEFVSVLAGFPNPYPEAVVSDLDLDGDWDVVANGIIYYQTGVGSFAPVSLPKGPVVDSADVNQDGRPDLLLDTGELYYQAVTGAFSAPVSTVTLPATVERGPVLADCDGDGRHDIAVLVGAGPGLKSLLVYLQSQPGLFEPAPIVSELPTTAGALTSATDFCAEDLDQDGAAEVLVSFEPPVGLGQPGVTFVRFSTSGAWLALEPPPGNLLSYSIALDDFDHQGLLDIAINQGAVTSIYYQMEPGMLALDSRGLVNPGIPAPLIVSGDIDGDGLIDLAGNDTSAKLTRLCFARSRGAFSDPEPTQIAGPFSGFFNGVAIGDFDHDGDDDLVAGSGGMAGTIAGGVQLYRQVRPGVIASLPEQVLAASGIEPRIARVSDLNGDGRVDCVFGKGESGGELVTPILQENGTLAPVGTAPSGDIVLQLALADLDGPGDPQPEVILREYNNGATLTPIKVLRRDASGDYQFAQAVGNDHGGSFVVVDYDSDGDHDILESVSPGIVVNEQVSPGVFVVKALAGIDSASILISTDLDHNGQMDLVTSSISGDKVSIYLRLEDGNYTLTQILPGYALEAHPTDVDVDGLPDLLLNGGTGARVAIQVLPGHFVENPRLDSPWVHPQVSHGLVHTDIDGDGELDAAFVTSSAMEVHFGGR